MKILMSILLLAGALAWAAPERGSVYEAEEVWTNQKGVPVELGSLSGRVQVVVMFFSQCTYACPRITADLLTVQSRLPPDVRARVGFVMASFDVERDQPAQLAAFAERMKLGDAFVLLHAADPTVRELAAVLGVRYRREGEGFAHSNLITVLDEHGAIVHQREGLDGPLDGVVDAVLKAAAPAAAPPEKASARR